MDLARKRGKRIRNSHDWLKIFIGLDWHYSKQNG
jgi:hypothetical protein